MAATPSIAKTIAAGQVSHPNKNLLQNDLKKFIQIVQTQELLPQESDQ